jgi:hypothetical protein
MGNAGGETVLGSPALEPSEDEEAEAQTHASREMRPGDRAGRSTAMATP